jgi:hypothetical protein
MICTAMHSQSQFTISSVWQWIRDALEKNRLRFIFTLNCCCRLNNPCPNQEFDDLASNVFAASYMGEQGRDGLDGVSSPSSLRGQFSDFIMRFTKVGRWLFLLPPTRKF